MQKETRLALEADIAHWNHNAYAMRPDQYLTSAEDSALCRDFRHNLCEGCPVKETTGLTHCKGTYATAAHEAKLKWEHWLFTKPNVTNAHKLMQECRKLAFNQEEFLRGLHPDNTEHEWEVPEGVLKDYEQAVTAALAGGKHIAVLCGSSPQARGLLQELRTNHKEDVSVRRFQNKVAFKSGGTIRFVLQEEHWIGLELDHVHVAGVPDRMRLDELDSLYQRIRK